MAAGEREGARRLGISFSFSFLFFFTSSPAFSFSSFTSSLGFSSFSSLLIPPMVGGGPTARRGEATLGMGARRLPDEAIPTPRGELAKSEADAGWLAAIFRGEAGGDQARGELEVSRWTPSSWSALASFFFLLFSVSLLSLLSAWLFLLELLDLDRGGSSMALERDDADSLKGSGRRERSAIFILSSIGASSSPSEPEGSSSETMTAETLRGFEKGAARDPAIEIVAGGGGPIGAAMAMGEGAEGEEDLTMAGWGEGPPRPAGLGEEREADAPTAETCEGRAGAGAGAAMA